MRYLGIDFGKKRVGIALSDRGGMIAHPKIILTNDNNLLDEIVKICNEESVEAIVIGESRDAQGNENPIMKHVHAFIASLSEKLDLPISLERESYSSVEARGHLYGKSNIANERWSGRKNAQRREAIDDNAAAIILQRFLDRK